MRLINPAEKSVNKYSTISTLKSEKDKVQPVEKHIWSDVTNWFTNRPDKQKNSSASFDINSFYPSITEPLLSKAISFAKNYTTISHKDTVIIVYCLKSFLFGNETAWTKKNHSNMFDVTMDSFNGAEVCELIGLFLLDMQPQRQIRQKQRWTLRRRRAGTSKKHKPTTIRTGKKDITRELKKQGLKMSISANLKICNFLDVTLNLTDGTHYPYKKPQNETVYIDTNSNHPPTIIKRLLVAIGRWISDIFKNREHFNRAKPQYENTLKQNGHDEKLINTERKKPATHTIQNSRKNRWRNVI